MTAAPSLTWLGIFRLGLVQMSVGAIAVLSLSTLNRIMVVELALPALLPGILVGLHYAVQLLRPRWGYGSDTGGRRTPWIIGGMLVLAIGGAWASASVAVMAEARALGIASAFLAYIAVGLGAGAAGTSVLALLAKEAGPHRGPVAGPIVWIMMIFGFALSAGLSGHFLDPYTPSRLIAVGGAVSAISFLIALFAIWGVERAYLRTERGSTAKPRFFEALRGVWAIPSARRLSIFIFISMLAFSGQELLLEPFAGTVFKLTPGQTARLSGLLHAGAFVGMIAGIAAAAIAGKTRGGTLGPFISMGCLGSSVGLLSLVYAGALSEAWPIWLFVAFLGFANGIYAITAIAAMMKLAAATKRSTTGTHMGVWGAAQGMASGLGGLLGTAAADIVRAFSSSPATAYLSVFAAEAMLFLIAAWLALALDRSPRNAGRSQMAESPVTGAASP